MKFRNLCKTSIIILNFLLIGSCKLETSNQSIKSEIIETSLSQELSSKEKENPFNIVCDWIGVNSNEALLGYSIIESNQTFRISSTRDTNICLTLYLEKQENDEFHSIRLDIEEESSIHSATLNYSLSSFHISTCFDINELFSKETIIEETYDEVLIGRNSNFSKESFLSNGVVLLDTCLERTNKLFDDEELNIKMKDFGFINY